jgi:DNA-binding response OmpR family regulator
MAKILVIEDEENQRLLYETVFREEGYEVVCAGSAKEAEKIIADFKPDLIVIDIQLPDQNGIEWMGNMLEREKIPFIINSAYSHYKDNFASWAAEDYVVKSSDLSHLLNAVKKVLKKQR